MVRLHLKREGYGSVIRRLEYLFNTTCHCLPNISRDRWLVNSGQSKFKPGWIAFDGNGDRMDCSSFKAFLALEDGSSWRDRRSIHDDKYWSIRVDEATSGE